jgi:thiamine pyrophosphokinase
MANGPTQLSSSATGAAPAALVVIGGGALSPRAVDLARMSVEYGATVIAADSGLDHAVESGLRPSVLVGDLDSISAAGRMWAYAHQVDVHEFPADKDFTDTELALTLAVEQAAGGDLLVIGGIDHDDPRLDHVLGTIAALGHVSLATFATVTAVMGTDEFHIVHGGHTAVVQIDAGQTFSLLALHGTAEEVTTVGARWPLTSASLQADRARGVSNIADGPVTLTVGSGVLTMVIP